MGILLPTILIRKYRIGVCKWSIGKQNEVEALALVNNLRYMMKDTKILGKQTA